MSTDNPREAIKTAIAALRDQLAGLGVAEPTVTQLVRGIVLEALEGGKGGAKRRGPGRPKGSVAAAKPAKKPASRRGGKGQKRSIEVRAKMMAGHAGEPWDTLSAAQQRAYVDRVKAKDRGEDAPAPAKAPKAKRKRRARRAKSAAPSAPAAAPASE